MNDLSRALLILDDDLDTLAALKGQLKGQYFQVHTTADPQEAFRLLEINSIQVVLCDLNMPEMNGIEFLEKVNHLHPRVIRLVLSGSTDPDPIIKAINAGQIYNFIPKPWKREELLITIFKSFDHHKLSSERDSLLIRAHHLNGELIELNQKLDDRLNRHYRIQDTAAEIIQNIIFRGKKTDRKKHISAFLRDGVDNRPYALLVSEDKQYNVLYSNNSKLFKQITPLDTINTKKCSDKPYKALKELDPFKEWNSDISGLLFPIKGKSSIFAALVVLDNDHPLSDGSAKSICSLLPLLALVLEIPAPCRVGLDSNNEA